MSTITILKKGLAPVISVTLLILIASAIMGGLFFSLKASLDFSPELSCTQLSFTPPIQVNSICYDSSLNEYKATVTRDFSDIKINEIRFSVQSTDAKTSWICSDSCTSCSIPKPSESTELSFDGLNSIDSSVFFRVNGCLLSLPPVTNCQ